jgi:hypothetical protein
VFHRLKLRAEFPALCKHQRQGRRFADLMPQNQLEAVGQQSLHH